QDADRHLVTYAYDPLNRLTDSFEYLQLGDLNALSTRNNVPNGNQVPTLHWQYHYDANGNQNQITDARGQIVGGPNSDNYIEFDHLNRPVYVTYTNPRTLGLAFQTTQIHYEYDGNGNYDKVTETKLRADGSTFDQVCDYTFDKLDRLQDVTNYDGRIVEY